MNYTLSTQAIGALMMALQKSLLEQTDIVPVLENFEIQIDDANQLVVMNPPAVKVSTGRNYRDICSIMPRYYYHCDACEGEFEIRHGMSETQSECLKCSASGMLVRIPQLIQKVEVRDNNFNIKRSCD